jgi:AcrR family transcriptional regulator
MNTNTPPQGAELSHNQLGQRIGRKGRDTRDRIIAATQKLLAGPHNEPVTLSAVARTASVGMTSIYSYFRDLPELLGAVLEPVMASAEAAYLAPLRNYWPDDELPAHCRRFVDDYYNFWEKHSRILHLRNALSDSGDVRMRKLRLTSNNTLFELFMDQIDAASHDQHTFEFSVVIVLQTGIERMVTVITDPNFTDATSLADGSRAEPGQRRLILESQAWLLEIAIAAARRRSREAKKVRAKIRS